MARTPRYQSHLNSNRPKTGMRQLVVCLIASVLVLTLYVREGDAGPVHAVRAAAGTITAPARLLGSALAAPFGALGNAAGNLTASSETLSDLKKKNEELTAKVAELSEAEATAKRLEKILNLQSTYSLKSTAARIIGGSGDAWSKTVVIDKGSTSGFAVGMPVCNAGGAIGQIIDVSATTSTVRLITDDQSSVSAMIQTSRAQGMLQGQADGSLRLAYVPADADVAVGDIVITSGIGGVFPKGLPLGTVSSIDKSANATYYTIVVRAGSSAENNEEVLVVTSLTEEQSASDAEVQSANSAPQGTAKASGDSAAQSGQAQADPGSAQGSDATSTEGSDSPTQQGGQ